MTRYLTIGEIFELYRQLMAQSGGLTGVRDLGALESALSQPQMTFEGQELYPAVIEKASTLCFSLINNHSFIDGNKRIGHAAMEVFLILNGYEIEAPVEEQEQVILAVASGQLGRKDFTKWLQDHVIKLNE